MFSSISSKSLPSFIWSFVRLQKIRIIAMVFLSLVWTLDATVFPYILGKIVDLFSTYDNQRKLIWPALNGLLIAAVAIWLIVEAGFRTRDFLRALAFPKLEADIRMGMFDHIQHHSPHYFNEKFAGTLANKISDMTIQVPSLIMNLFLFIPLVVTVVVSILFFVEINALFALLLAIWVIVHFTISFAFTPKCVKYANSHGEARSSLAGKIVDSLTNNFAVNLFYRFAFERQRLAPYQKEEKDKNTKANRNVAWMLFGLSGSYLVGGVVLNGLMIVYWIDGKISTGEIIQIFNTMWNLLLMLWFNSEMIPQFFQSVGICKQALSVMKDPRDIVDREHASALAVPHGEIQFENVTFQYGEKKLFQNKSVHIRGGEKVGLVGYSGAGKSTFVNLILRFYSVEKGKITIDGQDIAHVTLESLRKQVALIPQDPQLFHRTLEDNIRYGRVDAGADEVRRAAQLAHCDEFIKRCPEGYLTLVGERGTKLSGGERQRIAIARAILAAPPILILDEATSALDSVTEKYIQDSLEKLMQGRTTLVIAHRLSTLAKMDRILVFDAGKVVEEGSHLELLAKNGHYAKMWQMQAGGFLPDNPNYLPKG
jgi:ATP-binding cassette subfamily B protein